MIVPNGFMARAFTAAEFAVDDRTGAGFAAASSSAAPSPAHRLRFFAMMALCKIITRAHTGA
jgi:hypothetical protein